MHLREATEADADSIAQLHAENWSRAYRGAFSDAYLDGPVFEERRAVWHERYANPRPDMYTLLALDDDESLIGFACSFGADDPIWGTLLDNLHVTATHEGEGIGRLLLANSALWSERHYPDAGFFLWVLEGNTRARRFYEHIGATNEGPEDSEAPEGSIITGLRYVWHSIEPLRQYASPVTD